MSKSKKALADKLAAAVVPHLGLEEAAGQPPKAIAKTLHKLAKQLAKKQPKPAKAAEQPSPKQARKALAGELALAMQPYMAADETTPKPITKTIKRLAALLIKQRRKQAKRTAKKTQEAASEAALAAEPTSRLPKATRPAPVRRPVAKRPAAKGTPTAAVATATPDSPSE